MTASAVLSPSEPAEVLTTSPLPELRRLVVAVTESEIVITGRVSTYYLKQLAQESLTKFLADHPQHALSAAARSQLGGVLFDRGAYDQMLERTVAELTARGKLTVAEFRDLFDTSRKYALAFLEHLDERRVTRRVGDERVLGRGPGK